MGALNIVKTKMSEIWIDDEGILVLKPFEDVELDLDTVVECFETYKAMGIGPHHKVLQLIDATGHGSMTSEGRTYAAEVGMNFFIASAIVSDSLAIRLIVNFFNSFHKQLVPFKMFSNQEDAKKWLRTFIK